MKRLLSSLLFLPALLLCMALAQDAAPVIAGVTIPDSVWYLAATVIGIIVKAVASPLTQLLKIKFGYTGNAARLLYAMLSLLFVTGYGLVIGAFGQGGRGWLSAGVALLTALIKGYGDYSKLVQTSAAGAAALPASTEILPPGGVILPAPTDGLERAQ